MRILKLPLLLNKYALLKRLIGLKYALLKRLIGLKYALLKRLIGLKWIEEMSLQYCILNSTTMSSQTLPLINIFI